MTHPSIPATRKDLDEAVESLAQSTAREFTSLREEMVTKEDLKQVVSDVGHALMNQMDAGFGSLETKLTSVQDDVHNWKHEVAELQERMNRVEKKLGLHH